ncbi:DNA repair protein RadC [Candidatus Sumerlaeota bacterium]|nr:DNA repair protein RadC [Candidatus Sumerlaeota bacterium]
MLPEDRPREKLARAGAGSLTPAELLAILLRTGTDKEHAVELAAKILRTAGSLDRLAHMSIGELTRIEGLGPVKAVTIQAALELARRLSSSTTPDEQPSVTSSRDVYEHLRPYFLNRRKEQFVALLLNSKRRIQRQIVVSEGILNQSLVHPREAFQEAVKDSASAVIFAHNHPSGDPKPSRDDIAITHRLAKTGAILGIPVLDHVIVGGDNYYSFAESGTLEGNA